MLLFAQARLSGKQELMGPESRPTDKIDLEDQPIAPGISWTGLAGPAALGRSILLAPGVDVPAPWTNCERISLNSVSIANPTTLRLVRRTFLTRSSVVYEIDPRMQEPLGGTDQRQVWEVEPNSDLVAEATWRLACSNAVDARDVTHPRWPLAAMAIEAGASPATGRDADVVLPDGTPAWCDGGPLHLWEVGDQRLGEVAVVPHSALTRGLLTTVGATSPTAALAPDQLLAVADPSTRARIIAPAGSGKTRVLTERARHVLDSGVPVDSLLLVAFNKRAQQEMRERTSDHPRLQIQTLNALALSVLNGTNGFVSRGTRLQTINERDVRAILSDSEYVKYPRKTNTDPAAAWIDALTEVRLGLRSPQSVEDAYRGDLEGFAAFFPHYRQYLAEHSQVDFDEQIYLGIEVLLRDPRVRLAAEQRAEVLLVDEYQDLTPAHMLLLRLLAGPSLSIFGVGDDDQTIYGFSGATPEWLVRFEDHVPEAVHHALEVNYRCPAPVITAAFNLLSRNAVRVPKEIRPGPNNVRSADSFAVAKVDDQVQHVTDHVRSLLDAGSKPSEIAVLSRVNALLFPVQVALLEAGVPVNLRDGGDFLKSSGVESALAWLRLAVRPDRMSGADIVLAVRRPGRGISPRARGWMGEQATVEGLTRLAGRMDESTSKKITEFVGDIERITRFAEHATTPELIEFIRTEIGLDRALATLDASHQGRNSASNSDGLRSLIALGRQHADPKTFDEWLWRLLHEPPDENGVVIATVHKVKGLEWPHVIVFDVSSTIFPHRLSTDIEEERRVFHVAITRCTTSLVVTADAEVPSIFLNELAAPADLPHSIRDEDAEPGSSQNPVAKDLVVAEVGLRFTWGGYDCVVRAVDLSGAAVSAGGARITVPFGSRVQVNGRTRSLGLQSATKSRRAPGPILKADAGLYSVLKAWRLEQARADKVPAFVVFNDRTLEELSSVRPSTVVELLAISGIGPAKVDRYGDQIIAIIEQTERG
jgi:DNA helicase-2/ATP-dependent DNA helicase PcrA